MGKAAKVTSAVVAVVAVILLLLVLAVLLVPESEWARHWVEDKASEQLEGRDVEIGDIAIEWGWPPLISAENVRVANTDWATHDNMLEVQTLELVPDMDALMSGQMGLQRLDIEQPRVHLARRADGTTNWGKLVPEEDTGESSLIPEVLTIDDGRLTYLDEKLQLELETRLHTTKEEGADRRLVASGEGHWQDTPLQFEAWGAAPLQALEKDQAYPVQLEGSLGDLQLNFDGQAQDPLEPKVMQGQLEVSAPQEAGLASLLDLPDLSVPAFDLKAEFERDGSRWTLENIRLQSGESQLTGSATIVRGDPMQFDVDLSADRINLNRWDVLDYFPGEDQQQESQEQAEPLAQRLANRLAMLRGRQIQLDLSVDKLIYGEQTLANLNLNASVDDDRVVVEQLSAEQGEGQIQASGEILIETDDVAGNVTARFDQFDLGQALQPLRSSDLGVIDGQLNARFKAGVMTLRDTDLAYDAPAQQLRVEFEAQSRQLPDSPVPGLHIEGSGFRYGEPFRFDLDLGPLLDLTSVREPYPVKGMLASGDSTLYVDGTVTRPLELGSVDTKFVLEGPNPAQINDVTKLSLPSLPPYHLEGRLRWHDGLLRLTNFSGTFGESDLTGDLRLRTGERPMVWATLYSESMDYDDIRPLWGSPPGVGEGEVASERQKRLAREQAQSDQFFSDNPWDPKALRRMDAKVDLVAESVDAKGLPLGGLKMDLELDQGLLTLKPLSFGIGGGRIESFIRIDAAQDRVTGQLESSITGVNLKPLLRDDFPQVAEDSAGVIGGEIDLSFAGISMADFMAGADGQLELAMSGGQLDMLALEILGLDAGEALVAALAEADQVPIRCAYLRFQAENGQANLDQFFVDTDDANFTGAGDIDLATERIDLKLESHPKDISVFSANSPVQLRGTLEEPSVEVTSTELFARGVASVIGLVVAPPLAILPWVDPGWGEGSGPGCSQVLGEFRSQ